MWKTFKHHIPSFLLTILMDVILPLVIYTLLQKYIRPVYALLIAGSPPLLTVIFKAVWSRIFDALGFLVFFTFTLSAIVAIITRNPIVLLLEKSLVTGILSMIFTFTLIPIHCCVKRCRLRPLAYYFYQDLVPTTRAELGLPNEIFVTNESEPNENRYTQLNDSAVSDHLAKKKEVAQVYEWIYEHCASFRNFCRLITSIWAVGYFFEFLTRVILILMHLSINQIVIYGHIILSSITVILITSTIICIAIERKQTLFFIENLTFPLVSDDQQRRCEGQSINAFEDKGIPNGSFVMSV